MSSFIRTCILTAMVSSSLACDEGFNADSSELRASDPTRGSGSLRVIDDPYDLMIVDGLELQAVIDPATTPKDISTGVIEGEAIILIVGPLGDQLKVKLKILVLPAGPVAE
jgi:hypothetical protein